MRWWIDKPKLMGSHNPKQSELKIEGLTTIVSLIDPSEGRLRYNPAIPGIKWVEIPVRDYQAPSIENLMQFLKVVNEAPGTVLVHCEGGNGRTGTFGAAWLMRTGEMWATRAIETLRKENREAVETDDQKAVLIRFEKKISEGLKTADL
jgi:atypical dual specificity phosphatase